MLPNRSPICSSARAASAWVRPMRLGMVTTGCSTMAAATTRRMRVVLGSITAPAGGSCASTGEFCDSAGMAIFEISWPSASTMRSTSTPARGHRRDRGLQAEAEEVGHDGAGGRQVDHEWVVAGHGGLDRLRGEAGRADEDAPVALGHAGQEIVHLRPVEGDRVDSGCRHRPPAPPRPSRSPPAGRRTARSPRAGRGRTPGPRRTAPRARRRSRSSPAR